MRPLKDITLAFDFLGIEFFRILPGLLSLGIIGRTSLLTETAKVLTFTQDGGLPQVPSVFSSGGRGSVVLLAFLHVVALAYRWVLH